MRPEEEIMTPEEELALISTLLDELGIPKTLGLGVYSTYGRVTLLAKKVQPTPLPDKWDSPISENYSFPGNTPLPEVKFTPPTRG